MKYDIDAIIKLSKTINYIRNDTLLSKVDNEYFYHMQTNKYYKLLTATSKLYPNSRYLDLGTYKGTSALSFFYGDPNAIITSFDIINNRCHLTKEVEDKIEFIIDNCITYDFKKHYDIIFLDISHNGTDELKVMANLKKCNLLKNCLMFFDDIHLNSDMEKFWNILDVPNKRDITSDGHGAGTGVCIFE